MSENLFERVKEFLVKFVKDQTFRDRLENSSIEEGNQIMQAAGYGFSPQEFEMTAVELLESKERGEFQELTEDELLSVVGSLVQGSDVTFQPLYGVIAPGDNPPISPKPIWWRHKPKPPFHPVPLYGGVQPMYGIVVSPDLFQ